MPDLSAVYTSGGVGAVFLVVVWQIVGYYNRQIAEKDAAHQVVVTGLTMTFSEAIAAKDAKLEALAGEFRKAVDENGRRFETLIGEMRQEDKRTTDHLFAANKEMVEAIERSSRIVSDVREATTEVGRKVDQIRPGARK